MEGLVPPCCPNLPANPLPARILSQGRQMPLLPGFVKPPLDWDRLLCPVPRGLTLGSSPITSSKYLSPQLPFPVLAPLSQFSST